MSSTLSFNFSIFFFIFSPTLTFCVGALQLFQFQGQLIFPFLFLYWSEIKTYFFSHVWKKNFFHYFLEYIRYKKIIIKQFELIHIHTWKLVKATNTKIFSPQKRGIKYANKQKILKRQFHSICVPLRVEN